MAPHASNTPLRIIFAGTPEFAAQHLLTLLKSRHHVVAVYSQPDRPAGRGKKLTSSPVKSLALDYGIPVYQPLSLKDVDAQTELKAHDADIMVVVAYGLLLPKAVLEIPRLGCINVHASLLPRWRGAAPIQRAIEAGDGRTAVTIMQMDVGLDTGDMLVTSECPILANDTGGSLHDTLLTLGSPALLAALDQLQAGTAKPIAQNDADSCYAPKLLKEEAQIDWRENAELIARKIRAFNPFPVAYTKRVDAALDARLRVWNAMPLTACSQHPPGRIAELNDEGMIVACGEGSLLITQIQLPGKTIQPVSTLLRGNSELFNVGDLLEIPV